MPLLTHSIPPIPLRSLRSLKTTHRIPPPPQQQTRITTKTQLTTNRRQHRPPIHHPTHQRPRRKHLMLMLPPTMMIMQKMMHPSSQDMILHKSTKNNGHHPRHHLRTAQFHPCVSTGPRATHHMYQHFATSCAIQTSSTTPRIGSSLWKSCHPSRCHRPW